MKPDPVGLLLLFRTHQLLMINWSKRNCITDSIALEHPNIKQPFNPHRFTQMIITHSFQCECIVSSPVRMNAWLNEFHINSIEFRNVNNSKNDKLMLRLCLCRLPHDWMPMFSSVCPINLSVSHICGARIPNRESRKKNNSFEEDRRARAFASAESSREIYPQAA